MDTELDCLYRFTHTCVHFKLTPSLSIHNSIYKLLGVSEVSGWFPTVVSSVVAFPFDEVLILVMVLMTVKDALHLVFKFIVHLDRV